MDKAHKQTDLIIEEVEAAYDKFYSKKQEEIEHTIDVYFKTRERKDENRRQKVLKGEWTEAQYQRWRKTYWARGEQYKKFAKEIADELKAVNQTATQYVNDRLAEVYSINYNAVEGAANSLKGYSFQLVNEDVVRSLADNDSSFLPFRELDPEKDVAWNMRQINSQVSQAIKKGESIPEIKKRLLGLTGSNKAAAERTARTIVTSAENKARQDSYEQMEKDGVIMKKRWIATRDARTRDWHAELDGVMVDVNDDFVNSIGRIKYPADPSAHPANTYNCRCTLATKITGFKKVKATETANQEEPKTIRGQYKSKEAVNEYDYFSESAENERIDDIMALTGCTESQAREYLSALCGTRDDYLRVANYGGEYSFGWFYGQDAEIRAMSTAEAKKKAEIIDRYIGSAPRYEGTAYRGMCLDDDFISQFQVGGVFEDNGSLSSWTSKRDVAEMFAEGRQGELGGKKVILEIQNPSRGTPASHLSMFGSDEDEVLVSNMKNNKYSITSIDDSGSTVVIRLEEIDAS